MHAVSQCRDRTKQNRKIFFILALILGWEAKAVKVVTMEERVTRLDRLLVMAVGTAAALAAGLLREGQRCQRRWCVRAGARPHQGGASRPIEKGQISTFHDFSLSIYIRYNQIRFSVTNYQAFAVFYNQFTSLRFFIANYMFSGCSVVIFDFTIPPTTNDSRVVEV